jgi:hypothetical protein
MKSTGRRNFFYAVASCAVSPVSAALNDPGIGIAINYRSMQSIKIKSLWIDEWQVVGRRGSSFYLSPRSPAHEALVAPKGIVSSLLEVRAVWMYLPSNISENPALFNIPDDRWPWRRGQAAARLREAFDANELALLESGLKEHRLEVTLVFDGDRLEVQTHLVRKRLKRSP